MNAKHLDILRKEFALDKPTANGSTVPMTKEVYRMDWATDPVTRISKSGGTISCGLHTLHHWCKQQDRVALSSGEAELKGACKCVAELLEIAAIQEFIKRTRPVKQLALDAQATRGMILRQGRGKLKHLSVRSLWIQTTVTDECIEVIKIPRDVNHADALCSFHSPAELQKKITAMGLRLSAVRRHARRGGDDVINFLNNVTEESGERNDLKDFEPKDSMLDLTDIEPKNNLEAEIQMLDVLVRDVADTRKMRRTRTVRAQMRKWSGASPRE